MSPKSAIRTRRVDPFVLISVVAVATALYRLGDRGLWGDEIWQVFWSVQKPLDVMHLDAWAPPDLPFSFFLTRLATALGTDPLAVRLPQAISAVGSVLVLYGLGSRAFGRPVGIAAALLLAVAPLHVWYAQDARGYAGLAFYSLLALYCFTRLLGGWSWLAWIGLALAFTVNIYNHLFGLFALGVLVLIAPAWPLRRAFRDGWSSVPVMGAIPWSWRFPAIVWGAAGIALILCVPILPGIVSYLRAGGPGEVTASSFTVTPGFLADLFGLYGAGSGWRLLLLATLFGVGLAVAAWRRLPMAFIAAGWLALPFIVLSVVQPDHVFIPRYFLFMQPVYLLIVVFGLFVLADGVGRLIARLKVRPRVSRRVLEVGAVAVLGVLLFRTTWAGYRVDKTQDWGSVCSFLSANAEAGDQITGNEHARDALRWCLRDDPSLWVSHREQPLSELFDTGQNVWYIHLDVRPPDPELDRERFIRIPDGSWERSDLFKPRLFASFSFPISEEPAHIYYRRATNLPIDLTLHDVDGGQVVAGWPDYAELGPTDRRSFQLANPLGRSYLQIRYYNLAGRDLELSLDHVVVGTITTAGGPGNWVTASIKIPPTAGAMMLLELRNIGSEPAAVSEVHVSDRFVSGPE